MNFHQNPCVKLTIYQKNTEFRFGRDGTKSHCNIEHFAQNFIGDIPVIYFWFLH